MANQQGFSAKDGIGALSKILRHYDRSKMYDKEGNLRYSYYPNLTQRGYEKSYTTSRIDAARTHLNYNLAPAREGGQRAFIERRLGEVYAYDSTSASVYGTASASSYGTASARTDCRCATPRSSPGNSTNRSMPTSKPPWASNTAESC